MRKALVLNESVAVLVLICMIFVLNLKNCAVLAMLIDGLTTLLVLAKAYADKTCFAFFFLFVPICYSNYFEIHFLLY